MYPTTMQRIFAICLMASIAATAALAAEAEEAAVVEAPADAISAKQTGSASKAVEPQIIKLAEGKLLLPVPGDWKVVKPRNRIIHHEFSVAPAKSDETAGRMTIMPSGGGVKANIARWVGQFKSADGKPLGDDGQKIEEKKVGDLTVHLVDLTGDYQDSMRGPFGPKVNRPGYRMLAAIIPLQQGGTWFVKLYGPKATITSAEKSFAAMIEGVTYTP